MLQLIRLAAFAAIIAFTADASAANAKKEEAAPVAVSTTEVKASEEAAPVAAEEVKIAEEVSKTDVKAEEVKKGKK